MSGFFNRPGAASSGNGGGSSSVVQDFEYTNLKPTAFDFGGIAAGSTFDKVGLKEMFDMMLYPFQNPTVKLSSNVSTSAIKELGVETITSVVLTANVTMGTANIDRVEFIDNNGIILETQGYIYGVANIYTFNGLIDNTYTFTVKAYDVKGNVATSSVRFNFENPFYYGSTTVDVSNITEADIVALNKVVQLKSAKSLTFTNQNQKAIFVYPAKWGTPTVKDQNNFTATSVFDFSNTIMVNGVNMRIAISKADSTLTNFTYTFTF